MFASESREYFTLQESDGQSVQCRCVYCTNTNSNKNNKKRKSRKHFRIDGPLGNIFITPAHSRSSHKYKTPYSSSCHSRTTSPRPHQNHVSCSNNEPQKSTRSKNQRSRSLSVHISPATKNCPETPRSPSSQRQIRATVKCEDCRKAQVAHSPCHYKWGPVYQPPSNCPSNTTVISYLAQCGANPSQNTSPNISLNSRQKNRICPVYQPQQQSSLDTPNNKDDDKYPERVAQNLSEDRRRHDLSESAETRHNQNNDNDQSESEQDLKGYHGDMDECVDSHQNEDRSETNFEFLREHSNVWKFEDEYPSPVPANNRYDPIRDTEEINPSREAALYRQMIMVDENEHNILSHDYVNLPLSNGVKCEEEEEGEGESCQESTTYFNQDNCVQFKPVHDLPRPSDLRQWLKNQRKQEKHLTKRNVSKSKSSNHSNRRLVKNKNIEQSSQKMTTKSKSINHYSPCCGDKDIFPFRKTQSGNLKICKNQVAFQSKQLAILVNDPKRTTVQIKQDRECPPPIPPLCFTDPPSPPNDSCRRSKIDSWHHVQSQIPTSCLRQKRSKSCCGPSRPFAQDLKKQSKKEDCHKSQVVPSLELQTQNQCHNSTDFNESFHYRLRRAIHPDTKIIIGSKEFPCHSLALQAYSKYFDSIRRPTEMIHRITLPDDVIKPEDFPNLMDWILLDETSKPLVIGSANVVALYCAAQSLGIPGLKDHCLKFINEKLDSCDPIILQLYEDARQKSIPCKDLLCSLSPKLAQLFPIMYKSRQFLSLSSEELIMLIDSDDVKIQSELDIYDAAARWLLYDWCNRSHQAVQVMKCVRFGLLTPLQLTQIRHCADCANLPDYSHIYSFQEIKDLLCDGLTYAIFKENYKNRPGEFNKWVDWSKVNAPRPRYNADGDPDVFRLPAKIPVDGYPNYGFDGEIENRITDNKAGLESSDSNTAVRDEKFRPNESIKQKDDLVSPIVLPSLVEHRPHQGDSTPNDTHSTLFDPSNSTHDKKNTNLEVTDRAFERLSENNIVIHDPYDHEGRDHGHTLMLQKQNYDIPKIGTVKSGHAFGSPRKMRNLLFTSIPTKKYGKVHERAAIMIQAFYKGWLIRKQFLQLRNACIVIQRYFRKYQYHKRRQFNKKLQQEYQQNRRGKIMMNQMERVKKLIIPGTEVVVVFGGMNPLEELSSENNCRHVYRLNPEENLWTDMGQMPEPRSHCGVIYNQKSIILFGGSDPRNQTANGRNVPSSSCWSLNPITGTWRSLSNMKIARTNFGYCKWHGKIFVFGGKDVNGKAMSSCEKFDPTFGPTGQWQLIAPMQVPCMSMAVSKLNDKIFVVGGVSLVSKGGKRPILKTVLVYDPKSNSWSHQTSLKFGRCYSQLICHYNQLFLVGGAGKQSTNDGTQSLQDVTVFDDGEWEQVGKLKKSRHGHSMVKIGKHFLIIGGVSSESMEPLDTVEIYNTETNRSSSKVSIMPQKLTGVAAIVL